MSAASWEDFERIDMRVGRVVAVEEFPEARRPAWKLAVDLGPELGVRRSSAQIIHLLAPDAGCALGARIA